MIDIIYFLSLNSYPTQQQLQKDLDLNPSQFSQLVAKLDKRVFVVSLRPRGKEGGESPDAEKAHQ